MTYRCDDNYRPHIYQDYRPYSYQNSYRPYYIPPHQIPEKEKQFLLKDPQDSLIIRLKKLFLNVITLGFADLIQEQRFQNALKNENIKLATDIHKNGWVSQIGENFFKELIDKKKYTSLDLLISLEKPVPGYQLPKYLGNRLIDSATLRAFINKASEKNNEALAHSIFSSSDSSFEQIKVLLEAGLYSKNDTPINWFFYHKSTLSAEQMKPLINLGIDPNMQYGNESLLSHVLKDDRQAFSKKIEIAEMLLKAGANPNGFGQYYAAKMTILNVVLQQKLSSSVVELLLKYGANPNEFGQHNRTKMPFLSIALNKKLPLSTIELLLKYGANPNLRADENSPSPFERALKQEWPDLESIKLLKDAGGSVTQDFLNQVFKYHLNNQNNSAFETLKLLKSYGAVTDTETLTESYHKLLNSHDLSGRIVMEKVQFLKDCGATIDTAKV